MNKSIISVFLLNFQKILCFKHNIDSFGDLQKELKLINVFYYHQNHFFERDYFYGYYISRKK